METRVPPARGPEGGTRLAVSGMITNSKALLLCDPAITVTELVTALEGTRARISFSDEESVSALIEPNWTCDGVAPKFLPEMVMVSPERPEEGESDSIKGPSGDASCV